jgi:hypothetical protein
VLGDVSGLAFSPDQVSSTQAFYDPSDLSTLFQDAAGSTPVTADGQAVRLMRDKSGNGHHAIAPSDAARPLYKTAGGLHWLQPDGTDDWMQVSPTLDLGETWWHAGGWKATSGRAFTTTSSYQNAIRATGSRWLWYNDAGAGTFVSTSDPVSANVTTIEKASNASLSLRFNGVGEVSAINPFDETGVAGLALFTQANSSYAGGLNGRFYGGTFGTGTLSPSDRTKLEVYTAAKTGVTL